jgi:beta-glucosidase/6-phospho-beta-glucosidase/beta-galactosidase
MNTLKNLMISHVNVYKELRSINNSEDIEIGIVHNVLLFKKRYEYDVIGSIVINMFNEITNNVLIKFFETGVYDYDGFFGNVYYENKDILTSNDFFGLNFYANPVVGPNFQNIYGATCFPDQIMGDMYLPIDPKGFSEAIDLVAKLGVPIYITETGIADQTDNLRQIFINEYLKVFDDKITNGYNIKGIYFWTYRDNYEWNQSNKLFGFNDKFGNKKNSCKILQEFGLRLSA